jgi:hypothetical protein
VITAAGPGVLIRCGKQGINFRPGKEANLRAHESLAGNGQYPLDLRRMRRRLKGGIAKEGADGGQAQIAATRGDAARALQVIQESSNQWRIDLLERQLGWRPAEPRLGKVQQQTKGIPI